MKFLPTAVYGVWIVEMTPIEDERGFFARSFCEDEFRAVSAEAEVRMVQSSVSFNRRAGTLRGMHLAIAPAREGKLVRCTSGAIHDVALDLRRQSPSYLTSVAVELSATNHRALFIAPGVAHGFQTLMDNTEVLYQMTERFDARWARGVRWNDPAFGLNWPCAERVIHPRDASYPDFDPSIGLQ